LKEPERGGTRRSQINFGFFPRKKITPTHKTAHLQIARPKFAKELFFCPRITANLESLLSLDKYVKMKIFGEYIRKLREDKQLPLRKVAAALDIDTSVLSKIERNERKPTSEMIPVLAETLDKTEKEIPITYIKFFILNDLGDLKYLEDGLNETLKLIK